MIAIRVLLTTIIATLLSFAIALFVGIIGFGVANLARGGGLNMRLAYMDVGFPVAAVAFFAAFVLSLRSELRRYRQARAEYRELKRAA